MREKPDSGLANQCRQHMDDLACLEASVLPSCHPVSTVFFPILPLLSFACSFLFEVISLSIASSFLRFTRYWSLSTGFALTAPPPFCTLDSAYVRHHLRTFRFISQGDHWGKRDLTGH